MKTILQHSTTRRMPKPASARPQKLRRKKAPAEKSLIRAAKGKILILADLTQPTLVLRATQSTRGHQAAIEPNQKHRTLRRDITESIFKTANEERRLRQALSTADVNLLRQATKTFGGVGGAGAFLSTPAFGLCGKIPIFHAARAKGREEVMRLMERIDRGILT